MSMGMLPCRVVRGREEKERTLQEEGQDLIEYLNHDIRVHVIECQQFPICQSVCRWHKAEIVTITEFQNYILNIVEFLKLSCVLLSYIKYFSKSFNDGITSEIEFSAKLVD